MYNQLRNPASNYKGAFARHRKLLTIYCGLLILSFPLNAQCFNTGFVNASTFTTDNSIGTYDYSSSGSAQTSNNIRAVASSLIAILSGDTYYLKATGFNFNIPSYASICGVQVQMEVRATGLLLTATVRDNEIRLIKGGIITGDNKADFSNWSTTDTYHAYGTASDLWGTILTPADVNAPDFGVAISASIIALVAALPAAEIDHIRMSIDYNPILPVTLLYFKSTKTDNLVNLEWKTGEEEDFAFIELQRSINNGEWKTIRRYEMYSGNSGKKYNYFDQLIEKGDYAYRLKITSAVGNINYSVIKTIQFGGTGLMALYPNPAQDFIIIPSSNVTGSISVINVYSQRFILPVEKNGTGSYRVSIQKLPQGTYFVNNGEWTSRFVKD